MLIVSGIQKGIPKLQEKRWPVEEGETGKSSPLAPLAARTSDKAGPAQRVSGCVDLGNPPFPCILSSTQSTSMSSLPRHSLCPPQAPGPVFPPQMEAARTPNAEKHSKQGLAAPGPTEAPASPPPLPWDAKCDPAGMTSSGRRGRGQGRFCVCLSVLQAFPTVCFPFGFWVC